MQQHEMTKMRTSELTNHRLNWAVAKALGLDLTHINPRRYWLRDATYGDDDYAIPNYCGDFAAGGRIIESEKIQSGYIETFKEWGCFIQSGGKGTGSTNLIAAMRAFVAAKLGDEVILPANLVQTQ